jgi:hypothetical protein
MAHYGGIYENYSVFIVEAKAGNVLFNSTKGQERGQDTGTDSVFYIWEWDNQLVDVFRQ